MGIAILDHDKATVAILAEIIDEMGETPCPFTDKDKFLGAISPTAHRAAVIDEEFVDVIEGTKQVYQSIEILAMGTSGQDRCIQAGATGYLKKPFPAGDFRQALQALLLGPGSRSQSVNGSFIATDRSMQKIIEVLRKVAPTQAPVLIQGGVGHRQGGDRALHPPAQQEGRRPLCGDQPGGDPGYPAGERALRL
ncbi:MAG: hypothetical protein ACOX3E_01290 [Desulfomonilia bacterium]